MAEEMRDMKHELFLVSGVVVGYAHWTPPFSWHILDFGDVLDFNKPKACFNSYLTY